MRDGIWVLNGHLFKHQRLARSAYCIIFIFWICIKSKLYGVWCLVFCYNIKNNQN